MLNTKIEQQINDLRPAIKIGFLPNAHLWLLGTAALLFVLGLIFKYPPLIMLAIFFGLPSFIDKKSGPNAYKAVKAYDAGNISLGTVIISIISGGDSNDTYYVLLTEDNGTSWKYEFIPQRWKPIPSTYKAQIWHLEGVTPPAFCATDAGILIPRSDPVMIESSSEKAIL